MGDNPYDRGLERWEERFQKANAGEASQMGTVAAEVKIAVETYRSRHGDGPARAIDLGAGDGRHTLYLAEQGFNVLAVEGAPSGVELIRQKLDQRALDAELAVADLREYEVPDGVDLLVASYVLHLLPNPVDFVRTWQAKVRPGGVASLAIRGPFPKDPDTFWTPPDFELMRLFEEAGWFVVHAREAYNWREELSLLFRQRVAVAVKPE